MLTDFRVILILFIQCSSLVLFSYVLVFGVSAIRNWSVDTFSEQQLILERKNYLIGAVLQMVSVVQVLLLLLFLDTVNNHLTTLIKGAMCATGVLSSGDGGYMLLYWKMMGVWVSVIFWFINRWDNSEPAYPLTPQKYYLIFPIFLWLGVDLIGTFWFFNSLKPDVIATCCSVDFIDYEQTSQVYYNKGSYLTIALAIWVIVGVVWVITYWGSIFGIKILNRFQNAHFYQFLLTVAGIGSGIYTLQYFFVKYIYGLPSHYCLFDLFLGHYHSIGYVILGSYYGWFICMTGGWLYAILQKHLQNPKPTLQNHFKRYAFIFGMISYAIPLLYWWFWEGDL